jgi:hypothetical protein
MADRNPENKPLSQLIENIRNEIIQARGHIHDIIQGYPAWKERVDHVEGLLTCGLVALGVSNEEVIKHEIAAGDALFGKSLSFGPRGLGSDACPGCFVCGTGKIGAGYEMLDNFAAFVASKEEGEEIVSWFGGRARLDYRSSEPNWIQVKVGACKKHVPNLEQLYNASSVYGRLRKKDITDAIQPAAR